MINEKFRITKDYCKPHAVQENFRGVGIEAGLPVFERLHVLFEDVCLQRSDVVGVGDH
jgi:hypothetical protein